MALIAAVAGRSTGVPHPRHLSTQRSEAMAIFNPDRLLLQGFQGNWQAAKSNSTDPFPRAPNKSGAGDHSAWRLCAGARNQWSCCCTPPGHATRCARPGSDVRARRVRPRHRNGCDGDRDGNRGVPGVDRFQRSAASRQGMPPERAC